MVNTTNGPEAAYPGPEDNTPESKQGTDERPVDWDPPPGNPGSDQDAQVDREPGSAKTDSLIDAE